MSKQIVKALKRELLKVGLVGVYKAADDETEDAALDVLGLGYSFQLLTFGGGFALNHYAGEGASFVLTDLGIWDDAKHAAQAVAKLISHKAKEAAAVDADGNPVAACPRLRSEFPDYPVDSLPSIPPHWEDTSWHNDACPSFCVGNTNKIFLHVFLDYAEEAQRECGAGGTRFCVQKIDNVSGGRDYDLLATDDWAQVLALVATWEAGQ